MAYDLRHTGEAIDAAIYAVERGSVVTENTVKEVTLDEAKPASADAIAKELQKKVDKVEGKGLSSNDYTDEDKAQVAENKANIATNTAKIAEHGTTLTEHGEDIAQNTEAIERKAEQNGRYSKLTSGFAANIVGDGSATEEVIGFRPTAGEERNVANTTYIDGERNEAARITAIKGNSLVWGQLCHQDQYSSYDASATSLLRSGDGAYTVEILDLSRRGYFLGAKTTDVDTIPGHKYLCTVELKCTESGHRFGVEINSSASFLHKEVTQMWDLYWVIDASERAYTNILINPGSVYFTTVGATYSFRNPILIDLTRMFGAGNEPTTIEEFYQRMPVGVDINAYNEGELIDGHYSALRSTAFNQFNGTYAKVLAGVTYHVTGDVTSLGFATEEGGTTENITLDNGKYTPTQNGYIYATGNNICIHLCWSEYAHMEDMYEPYKPFVHDLSFVKKYFPNGMRSAGNVRDEIRYNATEERWEAVQRVGVVDLGSLTWKHMSRNNVFSAIHLGMKRVEVYPYGNNVNAVNAKYENVIYYWGSTSEDDKTIAVNYRASSLDSIDIKDTDYADGVSFKESLQGVILNYELAEPIVTPIDEDINLDYDCSDYGTEELISEGASAPLVADVVYAPNALSTLKQVPDILRRLAVLEAKAVESVNVTIDE